jgi:hypothetical protein
MVDLQYKPVDQFALRVGCDSLQDAGNGLTTGAGFSLAQFVLDYAWVDGGRLDDAHRVSLHCKLGGQEETCLVTNQVGSRRSPRYPGEWVQGKGRYAAPHLPLRGFLSRRERGNIGTG